MADIPIGKLTTVIQRIRALYHPSLDSRNKERLGLFALALVKHVAYLGSRAEKDLVPALEGLIRHVHSLAKVFSVEVAKEFRSHLVEIEEQRAMSLNTGDLVMLTAIGTVFPTSDHFHGVTTLAMLVMGRFLGQRMPQELEDFAVGTYLSILFIQYQQLSKRYVPELVKFSVNTLLSLAPVASPDRPGLVPVHLPTRSFRIKHAQEIAVRKLGFGDCKAPTNDQVGDTGSVSVAVLSTTVAVIAAAAEIWKGKPAFFETFGPLSRVVAHLTTKPCKSQLPAALNQEIERVHGMLERMLRVAQLSRRPLELHHHRPIAIRTYIPKFEDSFNPDKHYDPNREGLSRRN